MKAVEAPEIPTAAAAIDTTGNGRANVVYIGRDLNRDGIPDALQATMDYCICGNALETDTAVCPQCGRAHYCTCGTIFHDNAAFCQRCGAPRSQVPFQVAASTNGLESESSMLGKTTQRLDFSDMSGMQQSSPPRSSYSAPAMTQSPSGPTLSQMPSDLRHSPGLMRTPSGPTIPSTPSNIRHSLGIQSTTALPLGNLRRISGSTTCLSSDFIATGIQNPWAGSSSSSSYTNPQQAGATVLPESATFTSPSSTSLPLGSIGLGGQSYIAGPANNYQSSHLAGSSPVSLGTTCLVGGLVQVGIGEGTAASRISSIRPANNQENGLGGASSPVSPAAPHWAGSLSQTNADSHIPSLWGTQTICYLGRRTINVDKLAARLRPTAIENAHHHPTMAKVVEGGLLEQAACQTFQSCDRDGNGVLTWNNREIASFVIAVFDQYGLKAPPEEEIYELYTELDMDNKAALDPQECICLVDAIIRALFHVQIVVKVGGRARHGAWASARTVFVAWFRAVEFEARSRYLAHQQAERQRMVNLCALHRSRLITEQRRVVCRILESALITWRSAIGHLRLSNTLLLFSMFALWRANAQAVHQLKEKRALDIRLQEMHEQMLKLTETLKNEVHGKSDLFRKLTESQKMYQECLWKLNNGGAGSLSSLPSSPIRI